MSDKNWTSTVKKSSNFLRFSNISNADNVQDSEDAG